MSHMGQPLEVLAFLQVSQLGQFIYIKFYVLLNKKCPTWDIFLTEDKLHTLSSPLPSNTKTINKR